MDSFDVGRPLRSGFYLDGNINGLLSNDCLDNIGKQIQCALNVIFSNRIRPSLRVNLEHSLWITGLVETIKQCLAVFEIPCYS